MNTSTEMEEKIERGKRIKNIRENELHMNKTQLGREIGLSGQFVGLVEEGRGNLVYSSLKKLSRLSGHSTDFILFGLDDSVIAETRKILETYTDKQLSDGIKFIKKLSLFLNDLDQSKKA